MANRRRLGATRLIIAAVVVATTLANCIDLKTRPIADQAAAATFIALPASGCTPPPPATPLAAAPNATPGIPVIADSALTTQITTAIAILIACWNDADWRTSVNLVTETFLQTTLGTPDRSTAVATLQALSAAALTAPSSVDTVTDFRGQGPGFANAQVTWHQGNAVKQERWRFLAVQGSWLLDKTEFLEPELTGDAVGIEATIDPVALHLSRTRLVDPGTLVIHIRNLTTAPTSLSVFRTASVQDLRDRLSGHAPPSPDSALAGDVSVPPDDEVDLVLTGLAADVYTVVAGFHGPYGEFQVRDPFVATLAVSKP